MTNTAALAGFTTTSSGFDVRIECDTCHASKTGSLARAWAGSHICGQAAIARFCTPPVELAPQLVELARENGAIGIAGADDPHDVAARVMDRQLVDGGDRALYASRVIVEIERLRVLAQLANRRALHANVVEHAETPQLVVKALDRRREVDTVISEIDAVFSLARD